MLESILQFWNQKSGEVHTKRGKWFMRFDDKTLGAEIPEDIGRIIKLALWSEKRKRKGPNQRTRQLHEDINCHRTAFAALGLGDYRRQEVHGHLLLPDDSFKKFHSARSFYKHAKSVLGNKVGFVQIKSSKGVKYASHSFIAAFDDKNRMVCFEKEGFRYPFRVVPVDEIYKSHSYVHDLWAVAPIEEVKDLNVAVNMPRIAESESNI